MNADELAYEIDRITGSTKTSLKLPAGVCSILLHKFNWNSELLLSSYSKASNKNKFIRLCQITNFSRKAASMDANCMICDEWQHCVGLKDCRHVFCKDCWTQYIKNEVETEKNWIPTCPAYGCQFVLHEEFILTVAPCVKRNLLNAARIESFISASPFVARCPSAGCGRFLLISKSTSRRVNTVVCFCDTEICAECQEEDHSPAYCKMLQTWALEVKNVQLTFSWLDKNTKRCPNCHAHIQKNGGCMHMTCRNPGCRYEFCWLCMSSWWANHSCQTPTTKQNVSKQPNSRSAYEKRCSKFYVDRFMRFSGHIDKKTKDSIQQLAQQKANSLIGLHKNLMPVLSGLVKWQQKANKMLTYSTIFGYYLALRDQSAAKKFGKRLDDFETISRELNDLLEAKVNTNNLNAWIQNAQDTITRVENMHEATMWEVPIIPEEEEETKMDILYVLYILIIYVIGLIDVNLTRFHCSCLQILSGPVKQRAFKRSLRDAGNCSCC